MTVRVRQARPEDADALFQLLRQLATSHEPDRLEFEATLAGCFGDDNVILLVAEDESGLVRGYALTTVHRLLYTDGPAAQLHELIVDESARGHGVGTALLRAVEAQCSNRGARQLTVASRRAAGFYDRHGFTSAAEFLKRTF